MGSSRIFITRNYTNSVVKDSKPVKKKNIIRMSIDYSRPRHSTSSYISKVNKNDNNFKRINLKDFKQNIYPNKNLNIYQQIRQKQEIENKITSK